MISFSACGDRSENSEGTKNAPIEVDGQGFTSMEAIGYKADPDQLCAQVISTHYNSNQNICVTAYDRCQANFAESKGYKKDGASICPKTLEAASEPTWTRSGSLGFDDIDEEFCTAEYRNMYNPTTQKCLEATNGCEISMAQDQGFQSDTKGHCL